MAEPTLELLPQMVQRVLDSQKMLREDNRQIRRRLSRMEHALLALQRAHVDRLERETDVQDQIDEMSTRLERLEEKAG
jgi:hypothetical protein